MLRRMISRRRLLLPILTLLLGLVGAGQAWGATASVTAGALNYVGDTTDNTLVVNVTDPVASTVTITDSGNGGNNTISGTSGCVNGGGGPPTNSVTCTSAGPVISAINLSLLDGPDSTSFTGFLPAGGPSTITVDGGIGNDVLAAPIDAPRVSTTFTGGPGADSFVGGPGPDTVNYIDKTDAVTATISDGGNNDGTAGETDTIGTAVDHLTGGSGSDRLFGDGKNNILRGNAGNDFLRAFGGFDSLSGDGDNDTLIEDQGSDSNSGGPGVDRLSYEERTAPVRVNLDLNNFNNNFNQGELGENDQIDGIEDVSGGSGDDTLTGDGNINRLFGNAGSDTLAGGQGSFVPDTLDGGTQPENGRDTVDYSARNEALRITLDDVANDGAPNNQFNQSEQDFVFNAESVVGGSGPDDITGNFVRNAISSGAGADIIRVRDTTPDDVACGTEPDSVIADGVDVAAADCETVDRGSVPRLSVSDVSLEEGDSGTQDATFVLTLDAAVGFAVPVGYSTTDRTATAPSDYAARTNQSVTFAAGETRKTVTVPVSGDTAEEASETFDLVVASAPGATIADGTGTATIVDDDTQATVTVANVSRAEGNAGTAAATFVVRLSDAYDGPVTLAYATSTGQGDAADAGADYTATSGTVTVPTGQTSANFDVLVRGDTTFEPEEAFTVTVTDDTGSEPIIPRAPVTAKGIITNDDAAAALPTVSVAGATVSEGDSGQKDLAFTLSTSAASSGAVGVTAATVDGSARAGVDFVAVLNRVIFAPGERSKRVVVRVNGDNAAEPDEVLGLVLSEVTGATIGDASAVGTIVNDDSATPAASGAKPTPSLSLALTPKRDRKAVYAFRASGKLTRGTGVKLAAGCKGSVVISYRQDGDLVKRVTAKVKSDCKYGARSTFRTAAAAGGRGTVQVTAVFGGNAALKGAIKTGTVRVG